MALFSHIREWLNKRSIKVKLKLMIVGITSIGVLFAGISVAVFQWQDIRKNMKNELVTLAQVIADNSISAVTFSDNDDANEILATLAKQPSIVESVIYDESEYVLAQYIRNTETTSITSYQTINTIKQYRFTDTSLDVVQPIYLENKQIGTVLISTDLSKLQHSIKRLIYVLIYTLILVIFLSYLFAEKLQRIISAPIFQLTRLARKVSYEKNYNHRATKTTNDELGILTNDFNEMLNQVEQHDKALRESEKRFQTLIEQAADAIYLFDLSGKIIHVNASAISTLHYTQSELLTMTLPDIDPKALTTFDKNIELLKLPTNKSHTSYSEFRRKNGELFPVEVHYSALKTEENSLILAFVRDISERKLAEQEISEAYDKMEEKVAERTYELEVSNTELLIAKEQAENSSQAKSEFLANMSHEIRTPMNAVFGFTELLQKTPLDTKQQSYINSIQAGAKGLMTIINDILDLSKLEAGKINLEYEAINLYEFIGSIEEIFNQITLEKQLKFYFYVEDSVPKVLIFDQTRIRQILVNLIGNAIKFTDKGFVKVHIRTQKCTLPENNKIALLFEISDSGIGIDKEQQKNIFEKFTQQDGQSTKRYGGTGLGLSICLKLANLMEGSIQLKSDIGKGSTFTLLLPSVEMIKSPDYTSTVIENPDEINFNNATVLLVDDVEENRTLLLEQFSQTSITFIQAKNGLHAIELAKKHQPNLIIMDLRMPIMNGIEATKILRDELTTLYIPIVALTASTITKEDNIKSKELFDDILYKPVSQSKLIDVFTQYLPHNKYVNVLGLTDKNDDEHIPKDKVHINTLKELSPTTSPNEASPLKVLLVDDDNINRSLIIDQFELYDITFIQAENGKEAVDICLDTPPDIVLMDITMPIMDGHTANSLLKKDIRTEFIPVIAISGHFLDKETASNFYQVLTKPVKRAEIENIFMELSTVNISKNISPIQQDKIVKQQSPIEQKMLINQLIEIEKEFFQRAIKSGLVDDINKFSSELSALALKFNDQNINQYSEKLSSSASLFDIGSIETLLSKFPQIIIDKQTALSAREGSRE